MRHAMQQQLDESLELREQREVAFAELETRFAMQAKNAKLELDNSENRIVKLADQFHCRWQLLRSMFAIRVEQLNEQASRRIEEQASQAKAAFAAALQLVHAQHEAELRNHPDARTIAANDPNAKRGGQGKMKEGR